MPSRERPMHVTEQDEVHLIINPRSGYGGRKLFLGDLRQEMRAAGIRMVEHVTTAPRDATVYARTIRDRAAAVIVWGGDGTVNEVASGLAGSGVPMVPCPAGTENLLATELHMSPEPRKIVRVLRRGRRVDADLGRINDAYFLLIIGIGFDGEVVRRVTATRRGHISHLSYFWPLWRTFWEHDFPHLTITADDQVIFDDYGLAFVGNISRYAVGLRICRDAVFDDGLLDMVVFTCRRKEHLMLHSAWTLLRRHPLKGNVTYRQFRHARIEAARTVPTQVDGDVGPDTPVDIEVLPQSVALLIPEQQAGHGWWPWKGDSAK
jgi:YegS/Rv2252/BmrU family lipid kinase